MKEVKLVISGNGRGAVNAINEVDSAGKRLKGGIGDLSSIMYSTFGPAIAGLGVVAIAKQLTDAAIASQKMTNAMIASTGSSTVAAEELEFVRSEAERLGLDLLTSAESYTRLTAAAKGTNLEGQKSRDIFTAVSGAATSLGLTADETHGALNAIQQMMSKGTVQAEELRGQLGERLPGAFNIAARSMGVTTEELNKMLEQGQVVAEDFLPKFAAELKKTFEPTEAMAHSAAAEINRFNTSLYDLKVAAMDGGGIDALNGLVTAGTAFVNVTKDGIRLMAEQKLMFQTWTAQIGIIMNGGDFGRNWLLPAGRAELKAELEAAEQMYQYSWNKIQQRYGNAPGIVPPGDFVGPPDLRKKKNNNKTTTTTKTDWRTQLTMDTAGDGGMNALRLQNLSTVQAMEKEMELNAIKERIDAYTAGQQARSELQWQLFGQEQDSWLLKEQGITAITMAEEERRTAFALASSQNRIQATQDSANAVMNITNALFTLGGQKSRKLFEFNKIAGIANATVDTYAGASKALASVPYPYNIAAAASVVALGLANVARIQSQSFSGGAAAGGTGGGTSTSPIVTQPAGSNADTNKLSGGIIINIQGNVIGQEKYVEEVLAPSIRELVGRNVDFGMQPA